MIIATTDFLERPYKVPNQNESPDFENFLAMAEQKILINLFGYAFYKELTDAIEDSGVLDPIYQELLDGAEYVYSGITYKYNGLVDLLKPAIYAEWINQGSYKFTNIGWVQNSAQEKAVTIDSEQFRVQYVNEFAEKVGHGIMVNTLWGFLNVNNDDYPDLVFKAPKTANRFL